MTMESKARKNQQIACGVERPPGRGAGDAGVEIGVSVNQKKYVRERKTRGKPARITGSVSPCLFRGNPG
jgi:hypothetical protein